jgi:hypothetical protein
MPQRIQLQRRTGWRKPADAIVFTRAFGVSTKRGLDGCCDGAARVQRRGLCRSAGPDVGGGGFFAGGQRAVSPTPLPQPCDGGVQGVNAWVNVNTAAPVNTADGKAGVFIG